MNNIINCKAIRDKYIEELKQKDLTGCTVAFVQVGNVSSSNIYVRNKINLCKEVGIEVEHCQLSETITEEQLLATIDMLNKCSAITGMLVQLPLPAYIDENKIINAIDPNKDIDGFSNYHKGKLLNGDKDAILPCTPKGIMTILKEEGIDLNGKDVVVVGRSNIVGKPLSIALINAGATVTCCNSKTDKEVLISHIANSDIFISAIGQPNYFNKDFFLNNFLPPEYLDDTIMVDVGINKDENNKLCGDVDKELYPYFKRVTSVPGGVGVMTVCEVLSNIVELYERNRGE